MLEACLFLIALAAFLINSVKGSQSSNVDIPRAKKTDYLILIVSGILIWLGAEYVISSIKDISEILGIHKDIIALSCVALGTSLPEVIVSIAAARKGKNAIAVGNVLGSNLFNTYAVMAIPTFIGDIVITEDIVHYSLPFMVIVTIIFAIITLSKKISNWEGLMLVLFYVYYLSELINRAGI
jgi:cation:H+ antiporter